MEARRLRVALADIADAADDLEGQASGASGPSLLLLRTFRVPRTNVAHARGHRGAAQVPSGARTTGGPLGGAQSLK